jgi:hypothetical protein
MRTVLVAALLTGLAACGEDDKAPAPAPASKCQPWSECSPVRCYRPADDPKDCVMDCSVQTSDCRIIQQRSTCPLPPYCE